MKSDVCVKMQFCRPIRYSTFSFISSNSTELRQLIKEIFVDQIYHCQLNHPNPVIIDAGAHVGVATTYFASRFPQATITAIEPHPYSYQCLTHNLIENNLTTVNCLPKALAKTSTPQPFFFDTSSDRWFSTAGFTRGAWDKTQSSEATTVASITLKDLITQPIDLLKLDIEGAEREVLSVYPELLQHINQLIIEIHTTAAIKPIMHLLQPTHRHHLIKNHSGLSLFHFHRR